MGQFSWEILKRGDLLDELNIHGRIILKWIFKKCVREWSGVLRRVAGSSEHGNEVSRSTRGGDCLG
jgi:hypothetical protein